MTSLKAALDQPITIERYLIWSTVVAALLFVRSLRNLVTLDPGFKQDNLLVATLDFHRSGIPEARF